MIDLCPSDDEGQITSPDAIKRGVDALKRSKRSEYLARYRKTKKYLDYQAAYRATDVGKAKARKRNQEQKNKGNVSKYWKSAKGKALAHKEYMKKKANPGKLLMLRIGTRIGQIIKNPSDDESKRLHKYTEFKNAADIRAHFESTFEDWMSWKNYGVHRLNGPRRWHVGHRIPLSKYNANDPVDFARCWRKDNLFAQDGKTNQELNDTLPSADQLLSLRHIWPLAWKDCLPESAEV